MTVKLHIPLEAIQEAGQLIQDEEFKQIQRIFSGRNPKDLSLYRAIQLISNMAIDDPEKILQWGEKHYSEGNNSETD